MLKGAEELMIFRLNGRDQTGQSTVREIECESEDEARAFAVLEGIDVSSIELVDEKPRPRVEKVAQKSSPAIPQRVTSKPLVASFHGNGFANFLIAGVTFAVPVIIGSVFAVSKGNLDVLVYMSLGMAIVSPLPIWQVVVGLRANRTSLSMHESGLTYRVGNSVTSVGFSSIVRCVVMKVNYAPTAIRLDLQDGRSIKLEGFSPWTADIALVATALLRHVG